MGWIYAGENLAKKKILYKVSLSILILLMAGLVFGTLASGAQTVGSDLGLGGKLGAAIAKVPVGTGADQIDPNAPKGFLGIPGAPKISPVIAFLWAIWVGWIFSTVGAFGGSWQAWGI